MSSNIEIEKTCFYCNSKFIARTLTTKYCSHQCNSRHYKQVKREEKLKSIRNESSVNTIEKKVHSDLEKKEYLSVTESALLLGVSTRTLYRLIEKKVLNHYKIASRTIIRKVDINKFFENENNTEKKGT